MENSLKDLMYEFVGLKNRLAVFIQDREDDVAQAKAEIQEKQMYIREDIAEMKQAQRIQKQVSKLLGE